MEAKGTVSDAVSTRLRRMLVEEARLLVGSPVYHMGRDPETGLDCVGVILRPAHRLGLTRYVPPNYSEQFPAELLSACLFEHLERIDIPWAASDYREEGLPLAQAGDVLLFAVRGGHPAHLAYATGDGTMIHAQQKAGQVIEEPINAVWLRMLLAVWRWPIRLEV